MCVWSGAKFRPGWKLPSSVTVARCSSTQRFSATVSRMELLSRYVYFFLPSVYRAYSAMGEDVLVMLSVCMSASPADRISS